MWRSSPGAAGDTAADCAVPVALTRDERRAALNRFLAGIERRALRTARLAVSNVDDAMELVQEAMLDLARHYGDRSHEEWPLLFSRILQTRIRDWYRRSKVRNRVLVKLWPVRDEDDDEEEADPVQDLADPAGRTPLELLLARTATERLFEILASLPLRQQQAFVLRVWDGHDVAETAYAMECSEGSVKTHLARAMQRLRAALEEYAP